MSTGRSINDCTIEIDRLVGAMVPIARAGLLRRLGVAEALALSGAFSSAEILSCLPAVETEISQNAGAAR